MTKKVLLVGGCSEWAKVTNGWADFFFYCNKLLFPKPHPS